MKTLNKKQLAYILDIKIEDARAKMCNAWEKSNGIEKLGQFKDIVNGADRNEKDKIIDKYPVLMPIEILAKELNLPHLQQMVDDIEKNYLTRQGSKRYILCDFPEKQIQAQRTAGKKPVLQIPPALRSMLPDETIAEIRRVWVERFSFKDKDGIPTVSIKV